MHTQEEGALQRDGYQVDRSYYDEDDGDDYSDDDSFSPDSEKQIPIDPLSLKPAKFLSYSLPSSRNPSPGNFTKSRAPTRQNTATIVHIHNHQLPDLRRSKSCGEGRASQPSDEFDILPRKSTSNKNHGLPQKAAEVKIIYECPDPDMTNPKPKEEDFKCGALCLFLPGFQKKNPKLSRSSSRAVSLERLTRVASLNLSRAVSLERVSRLASFEKFECGSWTEANIMDDDDDDEGGMHSYFDLPLELIRNSTDDSESPVKAAFIYERDRSHRKPGVLKKNSPRKGGRNSCESSRRHVRFSTSTSVSYPPSPLSACITPRLKKARDEFNALLEAQGV